MGGNVRTVVLRSWDVPSRTLTIHSDVRAQKMVEIAALPAVALHVWDAGSQIQVRLWGQAHVVGPDEAAAAWARLHPGSRASYRAALVPGTPVLDPATLPLLDEDAARQNFAALAVMVMGMEWLHLGRDGHRRARFSWTMEGMVPDEGATAGLAPEEAAWLVP